MNVNKMFWGVRALFYKLKFEQIKMPSYIGKPTYISNGYGINCGKRVRIYPGLRVEIVNKDSKIYIGNNVSIGQNVHMVSYNDSLVINDDVTISGNVLITNCDHEYKNIGISILAQQLITKKTVIGKGTFIGYGAIIQAGTILGEHCVVGANSVVRGEFPDYCVIVGSPAKIIKKYNIKNEKWELTNNE